MNNFLFGICAILLTAFMFTYYNPTPVAQKQEWHTADFDQFCILGDVRLMCDVDGFEYMVIISCNQFIYQSGVQSGVIDTPHGLDISNCPVDDKESNVRHVGALTKAIFIKIGG